MNISKSKIAIVGLFAAASAFAGVASAQSPDRLSDTAYLAAARCAGLAEGSKVDASAIKSLLNKQDDGARDRYVEEKADEVRSDAKSQASHAKGYTLEKVTAELSGACQTYLKS